MTSLSFSLRQLRRPLVVLFGLLTIASALFVFGPKTATAQSSGTEDKCVGSTFCTVLHVKLSPASAEKLYPTVLVTREAKAGHDDEFFLYNNTKDGSGFNGITSGGVIWGSGPNGAMCKRGIDNAFPAGAYFTITVRGTATGVAKHVNMCANESPKATGDFKTDGGQPARSKTITVNVTTPEEQSKLGGIQGAVTAKQDVSGRAVTCNKSTSVVDITNNATKKKKTYPLSGKDSSGSFNTGLDLDPGTYKVYVNCIENGQSYPFTYPAVKVEAGKITKLTDADQKADTEEKDENSACVIKNWAFRWAACPIIIGLVGENPADPANNNGMIKQLEMWIVGALTTSVGGTFGDANGQNEGDASAYYKAWNSFRVLSVSIIIIGGVVMVLSQALGLEIFDAYTIRKLLPRLLVTAILIAISWWLMAYIVQFFNNLTVWIATAISSPFSEKPFSPLGGEAIAAQFVAVIVAVALINPMIVLSYIGTIVMALVITALTLAIRKMLLVFIIITAPIFLVAGLFQGTEKYAKMGRSGFFGLLAMGPIFSGTIALGQAMARLINDSSDPLGILRLGFLIAPLFAIPVIFMRIGGAASQLTGIMNDRSKGVFDRLKNKRGEERKELINQMGTGQRWSGRNAVTRGLNAATKGTNDFVKHAGFNPMAWNRRMSAASGQTSMQAAMVQMDSAGYKKIAENDDALAAGEMRSAAEALRVLAARWGDRERAERAVGAWEASGMQFGTTSSRIASFMGRINTGTGFTDTVDPNTGEVTRTAMQNAVEAASNAAGGNVGLGNDLAGWANAFTKKAGNWSLAAGYGNWSGLVQQDMRARAGGGPAPSMQQYTEAGFQAALNTDNVTALRQKGPATESMARNIARHMQYSNATANNAMASEAARAAAREAMTVGTKKLENITQSSNYGAENNVQSMARNGAEQVQQITENVNYVINNPTRNAYDARQRIPDASGRMVPNPNFGQRTNEANPDFDAAMRQAAQRVQPNNRRPIDPNRDDLL